MSLAHKYDEFSDDYSETDDTSSSDIATESDLQLFENGYQAGWQDAVTALQVEKEEGIQKAAQVLEEITFTNSEVRRQILNSVSELLQSIFANLLPHIRDQSLGSTLAHNLQTIIEKNLGEDVQILSSPGMAQVINDCLSENQRQHVVIKVVPDLPATEIRIEVGQATFLLDHGIIETAIRDAIAQLAPQKGRSLNV